MKRYISSDELCERVQSIQSETPNLKPKEAILNREQLSKNAKDVGWGMLAMLGIDYAPDQKLNLISELATTLSLPVGAVEGVLLAVGVGAVATNTIKYMNQVSIEGMKADQAAIEKAYEQISSGCMDRYDEFMDGVEERLTQYLEKFNRTGEIDTKLLNVRVASYRLHQSIDRLQEGLTQE
jgi:hypothetical protein